MDTTVVAEEPLFAGIDDAELADLRAASSTIRLNRGDVLFHQGDIGDTFYIVASGKMKMGRRATDGRESLIAILGPGEMLGELTLFDPGPRTATAVAVSEVELSVLSHAQLIAEIQAHPRLAIHLLSSLATRLRRTDEVIGDLVFCDVPGRVARTILDLTERFGVKAERGSHVRHELTQEELAQLVGASRETVNKALSGFAGRGWIRLEGKAMTVMDIERLRRRAR
ncbi:MAG: Crp/Fnr family transcriptional regulator [Propionibacteriaceae bacterium]|jgi:CRP-like cAMP-binding protein|nr:Crp/Fnr family transcriptional regulator [Propionibacteriaceae bacterium]